MCDGSRCVLLIDRRVGYRSVYEDVVAVAPEINGRGFCLKRLNSNSGDRPMERSDSVVNLEVPDDLGKHNSAPALASEPYRGKRGRVGSDDRLSMGGLPVSYRASDRRPDMHDT
uniref:Uncharacterized protein n=1 Tax=Tetranychus urticae TaxID=32264 RepID=T1L485_TETUR